MRLVLKYIVLLKCQLAKMLQILSATIFLQIHLFAHGLELEAGTTEAITASTPEISGVFCPNEILDGGVYGKFNFTATIADEKGTEKRVTCPFGFRDDGFKSIYNETTTKESKNTSSGAFRTCFLVKNGDGEAYGKWVPPPSSTPINYCREQTGNISAENLAKQLDTVTVTNFRQIKALLNGLFRYTQDDYQCALAFVNGIATLLSSPKLNGENGISSQDRQLLFTLIETYATNVVNSLPPGYRLQVGNLGIVVETAKFHGAQYYTRSVGLKSSIATNIELTSYSTRLAVENSTVDVGISTDALQMSINQSFSDPTLQITAYSKDVFYSWDDNYSTTSTLCTSEFQNGSLPCEASSTPAYEKEPYTTWGLLSIELDGVIQNLSEPVSFIISGNNLEPGYGMKCVYWNTDEKRWSTEGVSSTAMEDGVKCTSTHLTAFSALIEPLPLPFPGMEYAPTNNSVHKYILSILSSIGSVCSIIGLSFTVLTYGLFRLEATQFVCYFMLIGIFGIVFMKLWGTQYRALRRERSNRILLNLSVSLLLMHIMSLSGSKSLWDGHCLVPAASLHYLVMTSLAWMVVEAVHMYELLISVFVRPENRFLSKRFILAWGIPLIVVSICEIVDPDVYTIGRADLCLISAHENLILYYTAYIGPICIMLLLNLIIFCKIFRVLYQQTKRTKGKTNSNGSSLKIHLVKISPSQIKGAVTVFVLLGIGWIIGLFAIGPFEIFFKYVYCIFNAGQGALIFLFRVVLNPHAGKQWKKVILGFSPDSSLDVSFTTNSSAGGLGKKHKRKSTMISPTFISASNSVENSLTPSNPLSTTLATTLASILKSEDERAATAAANQNNKYFNNGHL